MTVINVISESSNHNSDNPACSIKIFLTVFRTQVNGNIAAIIFIRNGKAAGGILTPAKISIGSSSRVNRNDESLEKRNKELRKTVVKQNKKIKQLETNKK